MGPVVADIGGVTTGIAVYWDRSVWHSEVLPIGGNLITRDIAVGLRVKIDEAENIKRRFGRAVPDEGGGGAELRAMLEKARRRLCMPARLGYPVNVVPLGHPLCKPVYCTMLGILRYCSEVRNNRFQTPG